MLDVIGKTVKYAVGNASMLLRWSIDHPKAALLLALTHVALPILASEMRKMYWRFECGIFEVNKVDWQGNAPSGFFFADERLCFTPKNMLDLALCYMGPSNTFDQFDPGNGLKVSLLENPKITICEQYNQLLKMR